jgi:hypothetical protein
MHFIILLKIIRMNHWLKPVWMILFAMIAQGAMAGDSIIIKKDPRFDVLSIKQAQANQRNAMMLPNGLYKGFRIQVTSTPKRDDAFNLRTDLVAKFPGEKTYVIFQSPNFKVRIGNFLKKEEADKFKTELNKIFPNGVYIVEDSVEYILNNDEDI